MASQVWPWRRRYSRMATRLVCTPPCGGGYGPSCTTFIGSRISPLQATWLVWMPLQCCTSCGAAHSDLIGLHAAVRRWIRPELHHFHRVSHFSTSGHLASLDAIAMLHKLWGSQSRSEWSARRGAAVDTARVAPLS